MVSIWFEEGEVAVDAGSTLLEALLDAGHDIPNGCRAGACQSCMLQVSEGDAPVEAQQGLKDTLKAQGYFLACKCTPEKGLKVKRGQAAETHTAILLSKDMLTPNVLRLRLQLDLDYRSGQYVNLIRHDGLTRAYSLASVPEIDGFIELHLRVYENGQFSRWAQEEFMPGESIEVQGPFGDCFYTAGKIDQPLLLAATGTGLAPLYGILRDALNQGHIGDIHLYAGAYTREGLYLVDELRMLQKRFDTLKYTPVVVESSTTSDPSLVQGDLNAVVSAQHPDSKGYRAYFCGSEERVKKLRKQTFLSGANMQDIFCDLFTPSSQV